MSLFARFGVPEYWIVDAVRNVLEIYELREGRYVLAGVFSEHERVHSPTLTGLSFDAARVFAE